MNSIFQYNAGGMDTRMTSRAPLWPDFDTDSEFSKKLIRAKQVNDETYWPTLKEVIKHDVATLPLERFKVWASVWNVPLISNIRHSVYMRIALNSLAEHESYYNALIDPLIGQTQQDFVENFSVFSDVPASMNRMQMFSHLAIGGLSHREISDMGIILEIGAGIGDMADIAAKLGFKGKFIVYDFEEVSLIQRWYHTQLGLRNVVYVRTPEELAEALGSDVPDLTIATWSLTEMPFDLRDRLKPLIVGSKHWIIAFSKLIFGYDNASWMRDFTDELPSNINKTFIDVPFMPWDGGTQYFIGSQTK